MYNTRCPLFRSTSEIKWTLFLLAENIGCNVWHIWSMDSGCIGGGGGVGRNPGYSCSNFTVVSAAPVAKLRVGVRGKLPRAQGWWGPTGIPSLGTLNMKTIYCCKF
jgi:hypothetical protein